MSINPERSRTELFALFVNLSSDNPTIRCKAGGKLAAYLDDLKNRIDRLKDGSPEKIVQESDLNVVILETVDMLSKDEIANDLEDYLTALRFKDQWDALSEDEKEDLWGRVESASKPRSQPTPAP